MWAYFKANGGSVGTSISAAKTPEEAASKRPKTSRPGSWLAFATLLPTRSHRRNACVSRTRCGPARPAPPDLKKSSEIKFGGIFSTTLLALLPLARDPFYCMARKQVRLKGRKRVGERTARHSAKPALLLATTWMASLSLSRGPRRKQPSFVLTYYCRESPADQPYVSTQVVQVMDVLQLAREPRGGQDGNEERQRPCHFHHPCSSEKGGFCEREREKEREKGRNNKRHRCARRTYNTYI